MNLFTTVIPKFLFYALPKIHKSLTDPTGRPIISRNSSNSENASKWVDSFLRPFVMSLPSYIIPDPYCSPSPFLYIYSFAGNCSDGTTFKTAALEQRNRLLARGHSKTCLHKAFNHAHNQSRTQLLFGINRLCTPLAKQPLRIITT